MVLFVVLAAMAGLAVLVPFVSRYWGRNTGYFLAAGFVLLGILLTPWVMSALNEEPVEASLTWLPALEASATLRLDGLASLFALLVIGVGALIFAYCPRYLHGDRHARTYVLLTVFAASMLGLVLAADLILLFVFWELTTISSFFLIGGTGPKSAKPAMHALVITFSGGLALLVAVVLIAVTAGTTYLPAILAEPQVILDSPVAWAIGLMVVLAAFTKSAQLPFQSWLPGAMVAITPVSAYLHAATMVKAGIYLLMRFTPMFGGEQAWQSTLVGVGLLTAVVGAALALRQHDLKSLLAYSTVSQLGLITAVTGIGTSVALAAAVVHTFAHALFKATLFMLVGIIDREAGSRDVRELGGLRRVMPVTATLTGLAGLSMAGVPPLLGFVSKESIFQALAEADFFPWAGPVAATLGVAASCLTFAYGVRIFHGAFAGPTAQRQLYEPAWQFLAPAAVPAVAGLILGPAVAVLNPLARSAVGDTVPGARAPSLEFWHGFSIELLLSAITIAIGTALFLARDPVDRALNSVRTPPEGALFDRGYAAIERFGRILGAPSRYSSTMAHLAWPVVALAGLGVAALISLGRWPSASFEAMAPLDWGVLALLGAAALGVVFARRAFTAVMLLGSIGLLVSVWFMLAGAPDVALTLLLVEVLTAVVAVLVLRALPTRFHRASRRRSLPAGALAVIAGLVAMAGTLALTGHRDRSEYADYFLANTPQDTGGTNVVNTILVDFRALDTLGEATVLGVVALGLFLLLRRTPGQPISANNAPPPPRSALAPTPITGAKHPFITDRRVFQIANLVLTPTMLALSLYLFLRGHTEPGGGFIAALVGGAALAFGYVAHGRVGGNAPILRALRPSRLMASGLLVCVATGLAATVLGEPFLTPLHAEIAGLKLTSALLFDLGVYLLVLALITAAVDRLGPAADATDAEQAEQAEQAAPQGQLQDSRAAESRPGGAV